tara:strand:+ start:5208 stop:5936 length:729 start_codon:yes stop_codon:yes gene_type:complete
MDKYKQLAILSISTAATTWYMYAGNIAPAHADTDVPQEQEEIVKSELETILEKANQHLELGESQKAIDTCTDALQRPKYDKQPELNFFIGYVFSQHEGYETEADKAFTKAFDAVEGRFEKRMFAEDIYENGIKADWLYEGGKIFNPDVIVTKKDNMKFLIFDPGEWTHYYFEDKNVGFKLQQILKDDSLVNFVEFDKFMKKNYTKIKCVSVHPEGYMLIGLGDFSISIPTSLGIKRKIYKLF